MSNRERVLQLIEDIPDIKLHFVIEMLESLKAYAGEATGPDANGAMDVLLGKLDEAIDDMENGRVQSIDEAWEEIDRV